MSQFNEFVANYPGLTLSIVGVLTVLLAMIAIVVRWIILGRLEAKRQAFRIIRISPGQYVYAEKMPEGRFEELPFWRTFLWAFGMGWPRTSELNRQLQFRCTQVGPHYTVHLPGPEDWEHAVPDWAKDRRDDIVSRVYECFYRHFGRTNVE